jgi:hypothetical protein
MDKGCVFVLFACVRHDEVKTLDFVNMGMNIFDPSLSETHLGEPNKLSSSETETESSLRNVVF